MSIQILKTIKTKIELSKAPPEILKAVQECLRIKADGIYGEQTKTAFTNFKKAHNLGKLDWLGVTTVNRLLSQFDQLITEAQAEAIFERQITVPQLRDLNSCLTRFKISNPARLRHFMAQIAHESCGLKFLKELATGEAYEFRTDLGNFYTGDGRRYKGSGVLQVTGRANYQALADYLEDPGVMLGCDYVAVNIPFTSAGHWWMKNKMNALCDLGATVEQITRRVNGGLNGLADRKRYYAIALRIIV